MKLFVFDFDGTLSDSAAFICNVMHHAFLVNGYAPPTPHQIKYIIGITLEEAVKILSPDLLEHEALKIAESYKTIFREKRLQNEMHDALFDGSIDILKCIQSHNYLAGIATGKSRRGLDAEMDRHNIRGYFVATQTSDNHPSKPNPAMLNEVITLAGVNHKQTFMIGDTSYDMMMARNAGVTAIGVSWGCHDIATLKKSGAQYIINHFSELEQFI